VKWLASLWRRTRDIAAVPARWLPQSWRRKPGLYRYEHVDEFPDFLQSSKLYLAGENGYFWAAAMLCPCGCGDVIQLNLLKKVRPCWAVKEHPDGSASLMPSVWRREGCRSHFFLRHGQIDWCLGYSGEGREGA
jgi:hypothetical protein